VDRNYGNYGDPDHDGMMKPKHQKIKFHNPVLNTGGGFNWKNQYFQAPVDGTYFFSITGSKSGMGENGSPVRASIIMLLNGETIAEALSSADTVYGGFSYQTTRKLDATDKIELFLQWGQLYQIFFTGWLLEQNLILL